MLFEVSGLQNNQSVPELRVFKKARTDMDYAIYLFDNIVGCRTVGRYLMNLIVLNVAHLRLSPVEGCRDSCLQISI